MKETLIFLSKMLKDMRENDYLRWLDLWMKIVTLVLIFIVALGILVDASILRDKIITGYRVILILSYLMAVLMIFASLTLAKFFAYLIKIRRWIWLVPQNYQYKAFFAIIIFLAYLVILLSGLILTIALPSLTFCALTAMITTDLGYVLLYNRYQQKQPAH